MNTDKYQVVIGLEVHAQLLTQSKLFCGDSTVFGAAPNTQVSPISLAHPGTLPVLNEKVIELAVRLGIALQCKIANQHFFARKNYFYPDLPKGYQVSQHTAPVCQGGFVTIVNNDIQKNITLNRIHIEEDAGKSIHDLDENFTCIDLNRAGVGLLEIVTEPDINSSDEAYLFLTELRRLLRWLDVCDGNMEEGSMRCDANISVRLKGETKLGTRVEVKNLNSIRNVKKAIEVESLRLITLVENNEPVIQQTRSYNAGNNTTFALRNKEEAEDYRYFPEPDLPLFTITQKYISEVKSSMPALPHEREKLYQEKYQLSTYDAKVICSDREDADFYEQLIEHTNYYKAVANWMLGPLKSYCNSHSILLKNFPLPAEKIAALIDLVEEGKISFNNGSGKILNTLLNEPSKTAMEVAADLNLLQEADESSLETWIDEVIKDMPTQVQAYKSGKKNLLGLFAGEVKKRSKGKADMQITTRLLAEKLNAG
ncbi:MAG: Asp-tRNA(Asn)/Glu-tRNA(Gln) amidotransferase subunit GatB [Ferruginibacter sp.]